jgi:hypothetical protein
MFSGGMMSTEPDWLLDFKITKADLERLVEWIQELGHCVTTEEMTRRIIRGRLRYGTDDSPSALPEWVKEQHVLTCLDDGKWTVGTRVMVVRRTWGKYAKLEKVQPLFGTIVRVEGERSRNEETFIIEFENGETVDYGHDLYETQGEKQEKYDYLLQCIHEKELADQLATGKLTPEQEVDSIIIRYGAQIASVIISALKRDDRFIDWNGHCYLRQWLINIPKSTIKRVHHEMLKVNGCLPLDEIIKLVTQTPDNDLSKLSLRQVLTRLTEWFTETDNGWIAIKPPPPPWDQAEGAYYVYDPLTYEILLKPGEPLKEKVANRLNELGLYADVVQPKE